LNGPERAGNALPSSDISPIIRGPYERLVIAAAIKSFNRPATDLQLSRAFAIEAARLASETRGHNVKVLDVAGISPITDFFVLVTGTSARQMRAVADQIEEFARERDFKPNSISGYEGTNWILVDCVDVVIHIFTLESRAYYDLDNLWGDAKPVEWETK